MKKMLSSICFCSVFISATAQEKTEPASIKAYSKYDFVPGEKIIGFEDFSTGSIGDFPAGWNTNGAAEIVTVDGWSL